jgi:hypothetical protein
MAQIGGALHLVELDQARRRNQPIEGSHVLISFQVTNGQRGSARTAGYAVVGSMNPVAGSTVASV